MTLRIVLLVTALLLPAVCPAQDTRGQILGRVFDGPETDPTSTAFGMVTATKQMPRTIQFGLKLIY